MTPPPPTFGPEELQVSLDLSPLLGEGLAGKLTYVLRDAEYSRDEAHFDDVLAVDFDPHRIEYGELAGQVFARYVQAFLPYRGSIILDEGLANEDWERVLELQESTGKDIDGRDSVLRLGPVNYFDRALCRRAFDLTPEEIVTALEGHVESATMLLDGVLIVGTTQVLSRDGLDTLDRVLRGWLTGGRQ
jgi:hypothetical protein